MAATAGTVTLQLDASSVKLIRELQKAQKSTKRTASRMRKDMSVAFKSIARGAAVMGVAMVGAAKLSIDFADKIGKTADKIGVGVEALQELRFAAKRAGVEQNTLDMALQRFTRRAAEAANGTGEAKKALEEMGIQLRDNHGRIRSTNDLLRDVAESFKSVESPAERLRIAFKLFDSEGAALVNMLSDGAEGLDSVAQEARDLGVIMKESLIRDAEKAADKMGDLQKVLQVRVASVVLENADAIIALATALISFVGIIGKAVSGWNDWMAVQGIGVETVDEIRQFGSALLEERLKIEQQLADAGGLDDALAASVGINKGALRKRLDEIIKEQSALQARAVALQSAASGGAGGAVTGQSAALTPPPIIDVPDTEENANQVASIIAEMMNEIKTFGMTDSDIALINLIDEGATEEQIMLFKQATDEMRLLKEAEELANAELEEIVVTAERMHVTIQESTSQMEQFGIQAARNLQTAFADFLFDPFENGIKGMLKGFVKMIQRMVAEAAAAKILQSVFGGASGSSSGLISSFASAFATRDSGGRGFAGTPYLINPKAGPELFIPDSSGTFIPNVDNLGGTTNIFNLPPTTQRQTAQHMAIETNRLQNRASGRNR